MNSLQSDIAENTPTNTKMNKIKNVVFFNHISAKNDTSLGPFILHLGLTVLNFRIFQQEAKELQQFFIFCHFSNVQKSVRYFRTCSSAIFSQVISGEACYCICTCAHTHKNV